MQVEKPKPKKAIRDLPIHLKIEYQYESSFDIKIENDWNKEERLTKLQIKKIIDQLAEKIDGMKVILSATIFCPNCKEPIDETEKKDVYHCPDCNLTTKMRFGKDE